MLYPSPQSPIQHPCLGKMVKVYLKSGQTAQGILQVYSAQVWVLADPDSGALLEVWNPQDNLAMVQLVAKSSKSVSTGNQELQFPQLPKKAPTPEQMKAAVQQVVNSAPKERELAKKNLIELQKLRTEAEIANLPKPKTESLYEPPSFLSYPGPHQQPVLPQSSGSDRAKLLQLLRMSGRKP